MFELLALQSQHLLHRLDQLPAARMEQEAVEVRKTEAIPVEKIVQSWRQRLAHQRWQFRAEHNSESVILDVPSHDVFGLSPAPFADGKNAWSSAVTVFRVAQQDPGCAVTEQGCGHEHCRARIVDA